MCNVNHPRIQIEKVLIFVFITMKLLIVILIFLLYRIIEKGQNYLQYYLIFLTLIFVYVKEKLVFSKQLRLYLIISRIRSEQHRKRTNYAFHLSIRDFDSFYLMIFSKLMSAIYYNLTYKFTIRLILSSSSDSINQRKIFRRLCRCFYELGSWCMRKLLKLVNN